MNLIWKSIFMAGFALFGLPHIVGAASNPQGDINPEVWYLNTVVIINGQKLQGPVPSKSKLCFAPEADKEDLKCFLSNHSNITNWTSTNITFVPPKNAPPSGVVVLIHPYYKEECAIVRGIRRNCGTKLLQENYVIGYYKAHPHIATVIDTIEGKETHFFEAGKIYDIQGYRFGDTGRGIMFDNWMLDMTDIIRWTPDSILILPSKIPENVSALRVHNGSGLGNTWEVLKPDSSLIKVRTKTRGSVTLQASASANINSLVTVSTGSKVALRIFKDIDSDHAYFPAIDWAKEQEFIGGYSDGTFRPDKEVNRAEFLKMILEAKSDFDLSQPYNGGSFSDVEFSSWYAPYVSYAASQNIIEGYGDNTFRPEQAVTVAEGLKMAYRVFGIPTVDPEGSQWYDRYIEHAQDHIILFNNTIGVHSGLTRQDVVWIIWKLLSD
ncbi:MAG: S-layer homology domain-containing protein [Patescibacteria group bacterium]